MTAATHITAAALPPAIATVDEAIKVARWLGSVAAEMATHRQRKASAEALASWLADYAEHVECVEHGCQMLLLQAAELVGKATPSRLKS